MSDSFWNERYVKKAKKEHKCEYCDNTIHIGESYYRETGVINNSFEFYKLCERCKLLVSTFDQNEEDEYLSNLFDCIVNNSDVLFLCPKCNSYPNALKISKDKESCLCTCFKCDLDWKEDITLEGIKELLHITQENKN